MENDFGVAMDSIRTKIGQFLFEKPYYFDQELKIHKNVIFYTLSHRKLSESNKLYFIGKTQREPKNLTLQEKNRKSCALFHLVVFDPDTITFELLDAATERHLKANITFTNCTKNRNSCHKFTIFRYYFEARYKGSYKPAKEMYGTWYVVCYCTNWSIIIRKEVDMLILKVAKTSAIEIIDGTSSSTSPSPSTSMTYPPQIGLTNNPSSPSPSTLITLLPQTAVINDQTSPSPSIPTSMTPPSSSSSKSKRHNDDSPDEESNTKKRRSEQETSDL